MRSFIRERWFNYRPMCVILGFLVLGSLFACYVTQHTIITIISAVVIAILVVIISILKRKLQYFLVPLISFVIGVFGYYLAVYSFNKTTDEKPEYIQARIYSVSVPEDGSVRLRADSVLFDGEEENTNLTIYVYDNTNIFEGLEIGTVIRFIPSNVYKSDLFYSNTPNSYLYTNNLKYSVTVSMNNLAIIGQDLTLAETLREYIKENLGNGLTNENVEIAYSALFGDKALLSDSQYSAYRLSGVAHLLAVSGLHVSIIVGIIYWLLDKLKIKGWYKVLIVGVILFAYAYLCDFAVSVIRATIMALVMLIAPLMHREYDSLSSISFAGIIIFLINPLAIFDVSTIMSFSCVYGIALMYKPIYNVLSKTKISTKIAQSLAMSCSTTVALIFIMAYFFKTLNVISLFANIILIPIFTLAFMVVFVISLLSLIVPGITYLLVVINPIFDFINLIATVLGNLPIANFLTIELNYIVIFLYFAILLLISRICRAEYEHRIMMVLPIVALLVVCLV